VSSGVVVWRMTLRVISHGAFGFERLLCLCLILVN